MSILRLGVATIASLLALVVSLPVMVLALPFLLVAAGTRRLLPFLEPRFAPWAELVEFDSRFGWKPKARLDTWHLADDVYRLTTDEDGWRGRRQIEDSQVVVLGDSFAWGFGIDDSDFFADLSDRTRIKAVGTLGYNMVQELLWMEDLAPRLEGKLVVWLVYYGNDLYENLVPHMYGYRTPFVRQEADGWEIVRSHLSREPWFFKHQRLAGGGIYLEKLAELCGPSFLSSRAYSACRFLLARGKAVCRAAGAELAVVTIPEKSQYHPPELARRLPPGKDPSRLDTDYPDTCLEAICQELELDFLPARRHMGLEHYKETDCHWNALGHRRMAELVARVYEEHRVRIRERSRGLETERELKSRYV